MTRILPAYAAGLTLTAALDLFWVGWLMRGFYAARVGHLMAPQARWAGAVAFYILYPAGVLYFAARPGVSLSRAAVDGVLLGLLVYGTYDATNYALMKDWPLSVSLIDAAWGCILTAAVSAACACARARF